MGYGLHILIRVKFYRLSNAVLQLLVYWWSEVMMTFVSADNYYKANWFYKFSMYFNEWKLKFDFETVI